MELTKEQTIKVLGGCISDNCKCCSISNDENCCNVVRKNALHYLKENELVPAPTETSSTKENTVYLDNNTLFEICQETLAKISGNYSSRTGNCDFVRGYAKAVCDIIDKLKGVQYDD